MKRKSLLVSILTIIMCLSLTVGATFALFTSQSEVNIAVTSGTVDVKASVDTLKYKTHTVKDWTDFDANSTKTEFDGLGGYATVEGGEVTLNRILPGDGLSFNVQITNYGNVVAKYRTVIKNAVDSDEDLYSALDIKVNGYTFNGVVSTPWTKIYGVESATNIATIPVTITLPDDVDGAQYMGKTVKINVLVEAIQGNAETEDEIVITKDVEVSNGAMTNDTAIDTDVAKAELSSGTKFNDGETTATLTITEANDGLNTGLQTIANPDKVVPLTINIPEVAKDNQELIIVTLKEVASKNLASEEVKVFHSGTPMTNVSSVDALVEDSYFYDATTGNVTIAITNFSNFTLVEGGEVFNNAIANLNGLKYFRDSVNARDSYLGKTVVLTADIDMAGENWTPINFNPLNSYGVVFDGQGHTIKGLRVVKGINNGAGLFSNLISTTVKNLTIDGAYVSKYENERYDGNQYGILSGYAYGNTVIENVHVVNSRIIGFGKVGGIIGMTGGDKRPITLTNCSVKNTEILGNYNVGGLVGLQNSGDTLVFSGCAVDGVTIYADSDDYYVLNGGYIWDYSSSSDYAGLSAVYTDYVVGSNDGQRINGYANNEADGVSVSNVIFNLDGEEVVYKTETVVGGVKIRSFNLTGKVDAYGFTEDAPSKVVIPEGVTHLSSKCMQGNTTIKEVVIPSTVVDFGGTANAQGTGASGGMFYKSSVEKITLPEGLTEIPAATFNQASQLKEVNIPTSVTKIGINAFAGTGLTSLVIKDHVKEIGYGAFRTMANLETVTIEGNVYIPTYAFRECPKLMEIHLKGDDVTFGSGMIFTYNQSNNDYGKDTTIYVENELVKSRLLANGQFKGEIVVVNEGYYENQNGQTVVFGNDALNSAITDGKTNIALLEGTEYVIPTSAVRKTLKFVGIGDVKVRIPDADSNNYPNYSLDGATATFENITFLTNNKGYTGYAGLTATFVDCTFNGCIFLYGNTTFEGCTFNVSDDNYNLWTWSANVATFNKCEFNSDGKALLVYGGANTKLLLNDCIFNDNGGLEDMKAAVETGSGYGAKYEIIASNNVVNGYEINDKGINTGSTLWGNKNAMTTSELNVVIDGVDVY